MRVAVFENEYTQVEGAFKATNLLYFENKLQFQYFPTSQALKPFDSILAYDLVLIDIDLALKSELDGYGIINKINQLPGEHKPPILILTGHSKIEESLRERGITKSYPVITKPVSFEGIAEKLKPVIKTIEESR